MSHCVQLLVFAIVGILSAQNASAAKNWKKGLDFWGQPQIISEPWAYGKGHDIATHLPDQTFWLMPKKKSANALDEAIVMAYIARVIVPNGGYFCATQLRSRNKGTKGCPKIWTQYQNPTGDVAGTCFWLCEPGYSGENCVKVDKPAANACKYTRLNREILTADIGYQETGGFDTASVESTLYCKGFLRYDYGSISRGNNQDLVVAAREFLENGHGIVASPATVSAHGGWWDADNYSDEHIICSNGNSNITITANGGSYQTKVLCMPGFSGEGCTTDVCRICDDPLTKFNDTKGSCSDCIENYIHNADGKCVKCADGETAVPEKDICLKCKNTEYVKNGECVPRQKITQQMMYSCYPNTDTIAFQKCISETCDNKMGEVACMTENKKLGRKKCVYASFNAETGKWGKCE